MDHSTRERRAKAIAEALREGLTGDANPCWYPDASHLSWGVIRKQQRWVIGTLLVSECTTEQWVTSVAVPEQFIDGVLPEHTQIRSPATARSSGWDLVQSPDGRHAIIQDGSVIQLRSVVGAEFGPLLGEVDLQLGGASDDKELVMVEWLGQTTLDQLQASFATAFRAQ